MSDVVWKSDPKDVAAALRERFGVEPGIWACPCGCGNATVYARTESPRALLWIAGTIAYSPNEPLRIIGLENAADFTDFIARSRGYGDAQGVPPEHWDGLVAALKPLVPGGWT